MRGKRSVTEKAKSAGRSSGGLLYLYAILPEGCPSEGVLRQGGVAGVHPTGRLFALRAAGMVAAVSEVPADMFREEALNALLGDVAEVGPYALRHDEAIRALLPGAPALIPLSFGTVYVTPEGVIELLQSNAEAFRKTLQRLEGKREWTVKAFLDAQELLAAVAKTSEEARRLEDEAETSTPGRAYMLRKRREDVLAAEAARLRQDILGAVLAGIQRDAAEVRVDGLPAQDPAQGPRGRQLALKAPVLLPVDREEAFGNAIASLREAHRSADVQIEVTGPWPAYSFVGGGRDRV